MIVMNELNELTRRKRTGYQVVVNLFIYRSKVVGIIPFSFKKAIALMILLYLASGCGPDQIPDEYDLEGVLLFEENLSWFTNGYMPEAVALNPKTNDRFVLTRDGYGNRYFQWMTRQRTIIFQSNRKRSSAGPHHIFMLNPNNSRIDALHEGIDMNRLTGGFYSNRRPIVKNHSDEVYYQTRPSDRLMIESITDGKRREIDFEIGLIYDGRVSNDGKYLLLHDHFNFPSGPSRIIILDTQDHNVVFERNEKDVGYHIGDIYNNRFIYSERRKDIGKRFVILKDLMENISDTLLVSDVSLGAEIWRPVFGDETFIYFIDRSGEKNRIMKFDLDTHEKSMVYETRSRIDNLDVFRSVQ